MAGGFFKPPRASVGINVGIKWEQQGRLADSVTGVSDS